MYTIVYGLILELSELHTAYSHHPVIAYTGHEANLGCTCIMTVAIQCSLHESSSLASIAVLNLNYCVSWLVFQSHILHQHNYCSTTTIAKISYSSQNY